MKIAVLGYCGAGKSTLARTLGARYGIPVLHFDTIQFTPGWQERDRDEAHRMVHDFMENPEWVIEGNYTKFEFERRLEEADKVIMVDLPRPDMAEGCNEKMDLEFMWWILWKGRRVQKKKWLAAGLENCMDKVTVLKSQKEIDRYLEGLSC